MGSLYLPPTAVESDEAKPNPNPSLRSITTDELRLHNVRSDLWIAIQGKVYDASKWIDDHPGGEAPLLNLAGQDVTDAFVAFHPGHAFALLDKFLIGRLADYQISPVSRDYRRLAAEFSKLGMFEQKGHGVAFSLCFMVLLFAAVIYGVLYSSSIWAHLFSGLLLGFLWIQSGWIGHDSGHYVIMTSKRLNRLAQIVFGNCLTGISIGWWNWTHTAHHIAVNSLDYDPDLQHVPMLAVSDSIFTSLFSEFYGRKMTFDSVARFFISYQHLTYYPVMVFGRINLFVQSFLLIFSKRDVPQRWQEIVGMLVFWTWYPLLVSCLPNWGERLMFVLASFVVTASQHVQFTLNHFSASVYVGRPRGDDWFQKQTMGTINISCPPWMDWLHGGLQFQVEHHLFPRLPRCHLRKISPLVKELCKKHNLSYMNPTFLEANKMTIRTLRTAALQARDLTSPVPKNLVWEALNTHG